MRVAILDYGVGNLHSLARAVEAGGATVTLESSPPAALRADALVLPGVGAFAAAAERIAPHAAEIREALEAGLPALGICLGMQLLFERSEEGGGTGIALIPGTVGRLAARPIPHMGWNDVVADDPADPLFAELPEMTMYYANSFAARPADPATVLAWTEYGAERFPAVVAAGRTRGVQFHPEKSGPAGLRVIRNFLSSVNR
jgi:glutamine amidotransferase